MLLIWASMADRGRRSSKEAIQGVVSGRLSQSSMPDLDIPRFRDNPDYVLYDQQTYGSNQLTFNINVELFQNQDLRRAIALAIDGNNIMRAVFPETAVAGCGTAGPTWPGYDPDLCDRYFPYDPEQSQAILEELGDLEPEDVSIPVDQQCEVAGQDHGLARFDFSRHNV